jgi:hypothetical protein
MADTKISALSAASALGGTETFPVVQSAANKGATVAQAATYVRAPIHPGYISGRWYSQGPMTLITGTAFAATNLLRFLPMQILSSVTIQKLGLRVATLGSGGNAQCAIYARDATTGLPTGNPLLNTGNISTNAPGAIASAALTNTAFTPGVYWAGVMVDNTSAVFTTMGNNPTSYLHGSATFADIIGASFALSTTGTFGTWPDMTSVTPTNFNTNSGHAAVFFQVA